MNSELCLFCKTNEETLEHLFVECSVTQEFWLEVETFLCGISGHNVTLTKEEKHFGSLQGNILMNHIILLAKKHIYCGRLNNLKPNIQDFVAYVKSVRNCEFYISKVNKMYEKHFAK